MKKYLASFLFLVVCTAVLSNTAWAKVVNKTVAIINGDIITLEDYNKVAGPMIDQYSKIFTGADKESKMAELKKYILNQMIEEKLLVQEAGKQKIKITDVDVDEGIKELKKSFTSDQDFQAELKKQNMTEKELRKKVKDSLSVKKLIEQDVEAKIVQPTDDEINNYYNEHKKDFERPDQIRVRHILLRLDKNADMKAKSKILNTMRDIQKQLKGGADFAELAKKYSEDPGSKDKGGDVGFFAKGMMVKEFEDAAFKLKKGEVSDIIQTDFGYHIIKMEELRPGKQLALDDELEVGGPPMKVKNFVKETMSQERAVKKFSEWLKNLKDNSKIEIKEIDEAKKDTGSKPEIKESTDKTNKETPTPVNK
jgi:parvulin-like peptidyl-prolyl isomerase